MADYIMYKGKHYDLDDPMFGDIKKKIDRACSNPFWSEDTIEIGDKYYEYDGSETSGTYEQYTVEDLALQEARLMKSPEFAKAIYIRETILRNLQRYKYEYETNHDWTLNHNYIVPIISDTDVKWSIRCSPYSIFGGIWFTGPERAQAAIHDVIEPIMEPYNDNLELKKLIAGLM